MPVRTRLFFLSFLALVALALGLFLGVGSGQVVATEELQDPASREESQRVRELAELRDATSKTYELANGQMEWVTNGDVVHYQDATGVWKDIDNSLVADTKQIDGTDWAYRNAAHEYTVRFAREACDATLVQIEQEGKSIAFTPVDVKQAEGAKGLQSPSEALADMAVAENVLAYPELYPGVDFIYEPTGTCVKEYVVLRDLGAQNQFAFDFRLDGVTAKESGGRITFLDEKGETVFWLGDGFAVDDAGASTEEVEYSLHGKGNELQLTLTLSRAYLNDPARVFPIVIDPTIYIYPPNVMDTNVCSGTPSTTYGSDPNLRTGYYAGTGTRWTLIWFNLAGVTINPDWIDHCYIRLNKCAYLDDPVMRAYPCTEWWDSTSATWYYKPGVAWNSEYQSTQSVLDGYSSSGTSWWKMDSTYPVKKWLKGDWGNCGWYVVDTRGSQSYATWFYSANANNYLRPELRIVYTIPSPVEYLSAYPKYTYNSSGQPTDPLNCFFGGGAVSNGMWGTAAGVTTSIRLYCGVDAYPPPPYFWSHNVVLSSSQYVTFQSNLGNHEHVWCGPGDFNLSTNRDWDLRRYHVRLFQDPYATLGGPWEWGEYAGCNTVGSAHHEDGSQGDAIDMDWETAEAVCRTQWKADHPNYTITPNLFWNNNAQDWRGWYDNGYMSGFWLWP